MDDALVTCMNDRFFCRCTDSRGRKTHGGADVRGSRVPQDRAQDHAQSVETSAWLAAPVPISLAKALSAASMGGYGERAHTAGSQACGACPLSGVTDVFETGQTGTTPQNGIDWSEERCLGQLELDRVSGRKEPPDKNGGLGRRMAELDEGAMATSEKWYKGPQTVAFRARGVWNTVPDKTSCRTECDIQVQASTSASNPEVWIR